MTSSAGTTVNLEGAAPAFGEPLVLVVDAHGLVASSLTTALRHAGFGRVDMIEPDRLHLIGSVPAVDLAAGDIALVGLLYGDGRTTLSLIRPLVQLGCRVIVITSDQGLPLAGECLHLGAEAVLDKAMSFDRLVEGLRRLTSDGSAMTDEERIALLETVERHEAAERALHRPFQALTQREADVLAALVAGTGPKEIAHARGITGRGQAAVATRSW